MTFKHAFLYITGKKSWPMKYLKIYDSIDPKSLYFGMIDHLKIYCE